MGHLFRELISRGKPFIIVGGGEHTSMGERNILRILCTDTIIVGVRSLDNWIQQLGIIG